jgi:anti-anti-sigma factor
MTGLRVEVRSEGRAMVIAPVGELDLAAAPILERAVQEAAHAGDGPVVLDLGRLTSIGAAGVGVVVGASEALDGRLVVRSPNPEVLRVLVISGADRRLRVEHGYSRAGSVDMGALNVAYVRRLWDAFQTGGIAALADLVPDDVVWRPATGNGQVLVGIRQLIQFWSAREPPPLVAREFEAVGEDVLVHRERIWPDGSTMPLWSLYRFHGPRLIEVLSFDDPPSLLELAA